MIEVAAAECVGSAGLAKRRRSKCPDLVDDDAARADALDERPLAVAGGSDPDAARKQRGVRQAVDAVGQRLAVDLDAERAVRPGGKELVGWSRVRGGRCQWLHKALGAAALATALVSRLARAAFAGGLIVAGALSFDRMTRCGGLSIQRS